VLISALNCHFLRSEDEKFGRQRSDSWSFSSAYSRRVYGFQKITGKILCLFLLLFFFLFAFLHTFARSVKLICGIIDGLLRYYKNRQ
jgi:hypothetical protein